MYPSRRACELLSVLLTYPTERYLAVAEEARDVVDQEHSEAAQQVAAFLGRVDGLATDELQELFTVTFDLNPISSLEVGWHLHGDTYDRGEFLVRSRQILRQCGIRESAELPDHLAHLLAALPCLEPGETRDFVAESLTPALEKMQAALAASHSPFEYLLNAVYCLVAADRQVGARRSS
jgi:nitrate reductase molybdenum cofactor assembly chaperone NarJ/NarW